jgi:hypothetical protein
MGRTEQKKIFPLIEQMFVGEFGKRTNTLRYMLARKSIRG